MSVIDGIIVVFALAIPFFGISYQVRRRRMRKYNQSNPCQGCSGCGVSNQIK